MFGSCEDVAKVVLIALNVAVGLLSIALAAVGIWGLTSDYGANEISALITTDLFTAACVLVICASVVLFLLAFIGGLAALLGSRVLLLIYSILLGIFLFVIITGAIVGFFFLDEIEDHLAENMHDTLTTQYGVNQSIGDNRDVTEVWNNVQKDLKCCGVRGSLNSTESWFLYQSSLWFQVEGIGIHSGDITKWWFVPSSCCNTDYTFDVCQEYNAANNQPPKQNLNEVVEANPALYHNGCLDELEDKVREHIIAITVAAALLLLALIFCMILAVYMICTGAGQQVKIHDSSQDIFTQQEMQQEKQQVKQKEKQQEMQQVKQQEMQQVKQQEMQQVKQQEKQQEIQQEIQQEMQQETKTKPADFPEIQQQKQADVA